MALLTLLIVVLLIVLAFVLRRKDTGIPALSGAWPVLGHIHMFLGDNVVLTDPDDSAAIHNASIEKHYLYSFAKDWLGDGLLTAPPHKWNVNKKLLYPMSQQQNLNKFFTVFNTQGRRLVDQFSEHVGRGTFYHDHYVLLIGLETVCQTVLGSDVGEQMARNKEFVGAIDDLMDTILVRFRKVWLHFQPIYKLSSTKKKADKHLAIINDMAKELIMKRKSCLDPASKTVASDDTGDFSPFVDTIIKISQENESFDDQQILDEIHTLILTGYDTSATIITFILIYLGNYQDVQEKVFKELIEVLGESDRDIDKYDLPKLTYLEAVIKETMRVHTLAPMIARKIRTDVKTKNYTIPAGADCIIATYGLHRNPEWGDDAEVFNPERWMNAETMPKNPNLYAPFGIGKRYCVGKTYAMMSMKITLSLVLRKYRVKVNNNKK